jgi:hypothetical protein
MNIKINEGVVYFNSETLDQHKASCSLQCYNYYKLKLAGIKELEKLDAQARNYLSMALKNKCY